MGRLMGRSDFAGMFEREFVFEIPNGIVLHGMVCSLLCFLWTWQIFSLSIKLSDERSVAGLKNSGIL